MKKTYLTLSLILSLFLADSALAATFNPEYIISDSEMTDASSMSYAEIELFLRNRGGYISKNFFQNNDGETMSAAQIIYNAAHNYDCDGVTLSAKPTRAEREQKCRPAPINPKFLLVLLQKEQSLIEEQSPTQKQLDWATGYAVCDNCSMNDPAIQRWKGFGKQINSASLQFSDYMSNPQYYTYKAGNTYVISNTGRGPSVVTIRNQATAALYNYTPHVYNGNYNFFNLWNRYFNRSYPNNSLLQAKGESGVWLLKDGIRRPFLTRGALTSRYDTSKIIQVNKSDLEAYPIGSPIRFAQYSLVRSPKGTVYLIVGDLKRGFTSQEAFKKIGYHPEEVMNASWDELNSYKDGEPITVDTSYPTGALLQDKSTGGIYYVSDGTKAPLIDRILLTTRFKNKSITPVPADKLVSYRKIEPVRYEDGEILRTPESPAVFVIDEGKKRAVVSAESFLSLGYKWENVLTVPAKILALYPEGEVIGEIVSENPPAPALETVPAAPVASSTPETATTSAETVESPINVGIIKDIASSGLLAEEINDILNP
jgi:hypothetical protein